MKNAGSLKIMDFKKCIGLIYYELILTVSFFLLDLGFPHASQYSSVNVPDPHCFKSHTHATCLQLDLSWNICKRLEKFRHHNTHFTLYKKKKKKKKKPHMVCTLTQQLLEFVELDLKKKSIQFFFGLMTMSP